MFLEINSAFSRLFNSENSFFIPCWIGGETDISYYTSKLIKTPSLRSDKRKMRQHNMTFEVSNDKHQFDKFFTDMYLPYITKAHGNMAFLMPYDEMIMNIKNSDLILLKRDGEYIAGIIIRYKNGMPYLWLVGIKDGNTDYLKDRVIGIIDYFAINYLKEKGYKKVNYGASRAFLRDGVLRYKKVRGLEIIGSPKRGFLVKPLSCSIGIKRFFSENPFIYLENRKPCGAIFVENAQLLSTEEFKRIYKDFYIKGLHKLSIYLSDIGRNQILQKIPIELSDKISVYPVESFFQT